MPKGNPGVKKIRWKRHEKRLMLKSALKVLARIIRKPTANEEDLRLFLEHIPGEFPWDIVEKVVNVEGINRKTCRNSCRRMLITLGADNGAAADEDAGEDNDKEELEDDGDDNGGKELADDGDEDGEDEEDDGGVFESSDSDGSGQEEAKYDDSFDDDVDEDDDEDDDDDGGRGRGTGGVRTPFATRMAPARPAAVHAKGFYCEASEDEKEGERARQVARHGGGGEGGGRSAPPSPPSSPSSHDDDFDDQGGDLDEASFPSAAKMFPLGAHDDGGPHVIPETPAEAVADVPPLPEKNMQKKQSKQQPQQ